MVLLRPSKWLPLEVPWSAALLSNQVTEQVPQHTVNTAHLLKLEDCCRTIQWEVPSILSQVHTPLVIGAWEKELVSHPDQERASYLLNGLRNGFRIGYNYKDNTCQPRRQNMSSAALNPQVVEEYLSKECSTGRIVGPLPRQEFPFVQISPFGVIPKSTPGKWRLILDLSSPHGKSVNDGIDKRLCSLTYTKVDEVANYVLQKGRGTRLAKIDIQEAYRVVPVHPQDRLLLGMMWDDHLYVDTALPFGLRSAPKIFDALSSTFEWVLKEKGVSFVRHYLDDFITAGPPGTEECQHNLATMLEACNQLGVPTVEHKCVGPSTQLKWLGILINTDSMELSLPQDKLDRLCSLLDSVAGKKSMPVEKMESLVGHLSHVSVVVRPGRRFMRNMYGLMANAKRGGWPRVRLNSAFQADLQWWRAFMVAWNGSSIILKARSQMPDIRVWSDASGKCGCGALWGGSWFRVTWEKYPKAQQWDIAAKELLPIILAAAIWGKTWSCSIVQFNCDNAAVVSVISAGSAKDPTLTHLLRCLFFLEARYKFQAVAAHVPGVQNTLADALSRDNVPLFFCLAPQASRTPSPIPEELVNTLVTPRHWTHDTWISWFSTISGAPWHLPPSEPMPRTNVGT